MTKEIFGKLFGDKGYIPQALSELYIPRWCSVDYKSEKEYEKAKPFGYRRYSFKKKSFA